MLAIFIYTVPRLGMDWNLMLGMKILLIICVATLMHSILLWIAALLWFFWPKFSAPRSLLNTAYDFNKNPMELYPRPLQWFLVYVLPIFLLGNQVYFLFRGEYGALMIIRDLLILLFFVGIWFYLWRVGLKKYNSAN